MTIQPILRVAAWLTFLAIVIATLGPTNLRPHTELPVQIERAVAYFVLGLAFAIAYPRHVWWAAALVLIGAVSLELLQAIRPDRHGRLVDVAAKFGGACLGLCLGWLAARHLRRQRN